MCRASSVSLHIRGVGERVNINKKIKIDKKIMIATIAIRRAPGEKPRQEDDFLARIGHKGQIASNSPDLISLNKILAAPL